MTIDPWDDVRADTFAGLDEPQELSGMSFNWTVGSDGIVGFVGLALALGDGFNVVHPGHLGDDFVRSLFGLLLDHAVIRPRAAGRA